MAEAPSCRKSQLFKVKCLHCLRGYCTNRVFKTQITRNLRTKKSPALTHVCVSSPWLCCIVFVGGVMLIFPDRLHTENKLNTSLMYARAPRQLTLPTYITRSVMRIEPCCIVGSPCVVKVRALKSVCCTLLCCCVVDLVCRGVAVVRCAAYVL